MKEGACYLKQQKVVPVLILILLWYSDLIYISSKALSTLVLSNYYTALKSSRNRKRKKCVNTRGLSQTIGGALVNNSPTMEDIGPEENREIENLKVDAHVIVEDFLQ